jgi:TPP-dependent trihydroxycyclohexane-1,2-dione (THcHDO) dehydratase
MAVIEAKIPVLFFQEGKRVVAYSPALDLSSCGDTEKQARERFAEAVEIFIGEINEMGTVEEVLEECG